MADDGLIVGPGGGLLTSGGAAARCPACCAPRPACDHYLRAALCPGPPVCSGVTPEVYVRCDYTCRSGSGDVIGVGPWGQCYEVDRVVRYIQDPGTGEPPPPGYAYIPPDGWIVPQDEFDCYAHCGLCHHQPNLWYEVRPCACSPNPGGVPLYVGCEAYHAMVAAARAFGDPFACFAFGAFHPGIGRIVCFTLGGGVVHGQRPPGIEIQGGGLHAGGCCECCDWPCTSNSWREYRIVDGVTVRDVRKLCCCHEENSVGVAESRRLLYGRTFAGEYVLMQEEIASWRLDVTGLRTTYRTIQHHPQAPPPHYEENHYPGARACDWEQIYWPVVWANPFEPQPWTDMIGVIARTCAGGSAAYTIMGNFGHGPEIAYTVEASASISGDLGDCDGGCSQIPGPAIQPGGHGGPVSPGGPGSVGGGDGAGAHGARGCHGCGHAMGPGSSIAEIERALAEG